MITGPVKEHSGMLFSADNKLADVIQVHPPLLSVLSHFGIRLGFGDGTVEEVCLKYGINTRFFLIVCNVYAFGHYRPEEDDILSIGLEELIGYLTASHGYYRDEELPEITEHLERMGECCDGRHMKIIKTFFDEYRREVLNHFDYEEYTVFPYISGLLKGDHVDGYDINRYEDNHDNIEEKLNDLKNIIIKYLPETCASKERNRMLYRIFLFENDLNRHALIEEKILIPYVRQIEKINEKR